jgi:hypothetical protein
MKPAVVYINYEPSNICLGMFSPADCVASFGNSANKFSFSDLGVLGERYICIAIGR